MSVMDPKDTQQRQSLTGVSSQIPAGLPIPGSPGTASLDDIKAASQLAPTPAEAGAQARNMVVSEPRQGGLADIVQQARAKNAPPAPVQETPDTVDQFNAPPAMQPSSKEAAFPDMMTTAQVQTAKTIVDPALKEKASALDLAMQKKLEADTELAALQQEGMAQESALRQEQVQKEALENEALNARVDSMREKQQQAVDAYQDSFNKYSSEAIVNPWSRASTGTKILAGLSIVLGGLSGPGGAETARGVIDSQINQDIELQKANINKKKGELSMLQQHAKDLQDMGMNDINVTKSMKALAAQSLANQLKGMAAQRQASDPAGAVKLAQLEADYAQKSMQLQGEVAESQKQTVTQQPAFSLSNKKPVEGERFKELRAAEGTVRAYKQIKELLKDPETRKKVGRIAGEFAKIGARWFGDAKAAELSSKVDQAVLQALKAATGAQMTDAERAYIMETLPRMNENFESFEAKMNDRINTNLQAYSRLKANSGRHFDTSEFEDFTDFETELGFKPTE